MGSAKITFRTQDRSAIVPSLPGVYAGISIVSTKGKIGEPVLVTSPEDLVDKFGIPDPSLGVSWYSAFTYLAQGNLLWVTRAAHSDAKFAAATVRWKIDAYDTGYPVYTYQPDHVVNPIAAGLTQSQIDSYQFEVSATDRVYSDSGANISKSDTSDLVRVDTLGTIQSGDKVVISNTAIGSLTNSETFHTVDEVQTIVANYDAVTVSAPVVSALEGAVIYKVTAGPAYTPYTGDPAIGKTTSNSATIFITNADYIQNGDTIRIGGVGGPEVTVVTKEAYSEDTYWLQLSSNAVVTAGMNVYLMVEDEFEDRDAFLVYAYSQSVDFNRVSIGISPSSNYDDAFNILVYFDGVLEETWEVSRKNKLDGYQRQMFLEDKINGKSRFIRVKDNPNAVDLSEVPNMPLYTDYSLWRQNSVDLFQDTTLEIQENLLQGHVQVQFASDPAAEVAVGNRVKFVTGEGTLSSEYKVQSIDSINNFVVLDREIVETQISTTWTDSLNVVHNTTMYFFDVTYQDIPNGVYDGVQRYKISELTNVFYNYPLNSPFTISGNEGVLLEPGANLLLGGSGGSVATVSDINNAIKLLENKEKTPVTLMMDGGHAIPAVAQAIFNLCVKQKLCHGYLSSDPTAELGVNYLTDIVAYKNSTNLNTELCSMFTGWLKVQDDYNQKEVWIAPDGFAAAAQSFVTREYNIFTPAAGWVRGKITALDVAQKFDEPARDYLVDNRLNPIRYKEGEGLAIWGNETLLARPSPLQLRSVSMLLIAIKYGVENMLEYKHFDLNNESTWGLVEGSLDGFMRDQIKAKGGVYDYQVAVQDVITDQDLDTRKMPVFIGIQPTSDIQEIPVTLAIYNSGVDIQVAV